MFEIYPMMNKVSMNSPCLSGDSPSFWLLLEFCAGSVEDESWRSVFSDGEYPNVIPGRGSGFEEPQKTTAGVL